MPVKPEGVYADKRGQWYFKVSLGKDPLTGRRKQLTRRGFRTAAEAAKARHTVLSSIDIGLVKPNSGSLIVDELLDIYLDGIDADERLSLKTRFAYRYKPDDYVRPLLGRIKLRDVTSTTVLAWQQRLLQLMGRQRKDPWAKWRSRGRGFDPSPPAHNGCSEAVRFESVALEHAFV